MVLTVLPPRPRGELFDNPVCNGLWAALMKLDVAMQWEFLLSRLPPEKVASASRADLSWTGDIAKLGKHRFDEFVGVLFEEDFSLRGAWVTGRERVVALAVPVDGKHRQAPRRPSVPGAGPRRCLG